MDSLRWQINRLHSRTERSEALIYLLSSTIHLQTALERAKSDKFGSVTMRQCLESASWESYGENCCSAWQLMSCCATGLGVERLSYIG